MEVLIPITQPTKLNWAASLLGGCVAIAGGAFFGTVIATFSMRFNMAGGSSAEQAQAALAAGFSPLIILGMLLQLLTSAAGGYVAAGLAGTRAIAHAAMASVFPLLFMVVMYANPGSRFGTFWYVAYSVLSPVVASLAGGYLFAQNRR